MGRWIAHPQVKRCMGYDYGGWSTSIIQFTIFRHMSQKDVTTCYLGIFYYRTNASQKSCNNVLLCGWNHLHLHLLEADGFWGGLRDRSI